MTLEQLHADVVERLGRIETHQSNAAARLDKINGSVDRHEEEITVLQTQTKMVGHIWKGVIGVALVALGASSDVLTKVLESL